MRTIVQVEARDDWILKVTFSSCDIRIFDVRPILICEAFAPLADIAEFKRVRNGGYFVEWPSGADLSADTLFTNAQEHA
jgi:hypothetical protein